ADGRMLARCAQFEEELALCTIEPREIAAARLRDTRHRTNVQRGRRAAGTAAAEPHVKRLGRVEVEPVDAERLGPSIAPPLYTEGEVYGGPRVGGSDAG